MEQHVLMVGGTGMLAGVTEGLADDGHRVSLLARKGARFTYPGVKGYNANYYDEDEFAAALAQAVETAGPVDLAVTWFQTPRVHGARRLAELVGTPEKPGRLFQVLSHLAVDPIHPERLEDATLVAEGLPSCQLRQVVLGFKVSREGESRWLTDAEISGGVLDAIHADKVYSVVGQVKPWSSRP